MGREFQVIFGARSRDDLKGIVRHIRQGSRSPELASQFGATLIQRALSLSKLPERGRIVPELGIPGVREIIHRSYRIVYRIVPGQVQVLRFWNAARGIPEISVDDFRD